ncbi:MAG: translocation/assembly module TamB domain-containing protein, partial [Acidobacteriota bacterium]|nr:translocation/assembly module TamB domain-containing protein [Acidobacteriota bacterium]
MSRVPSRLRRPIWLAGASVLVLVTVGWVVSSILPGMAAGWLLSLAEERWGVVGQTGEVRLNPLSLRLDVRHLALATVKTADDPFLRVESVIVDLPWSILTGTRAVDAVQLVAPVVSVRRAQDGVSNLPRFSSLQSSLPTSEPSVSTPWRLDTVSVQRAMVSWEDATQDLRFATGPLGLELRPEPEGLATSGEFRLVGSTRLARGTAETQVEPFVIPMTVAPSAVTVDGFAVSAPEGRLEAGAEVTLGAGSRVQAHYDLDVVLDRLSTWADQPLSVMGDLRVSGTIMGPPGAPVVSARLEGDRVRWEQVAVHEFSSVLRFDGARLTVEQLNARVAEGVIEGTASLEVLDGQTQGNARMAWTELRGQSLAAMWTDTPLLVDSTLTGVATIAWSGHGPRDVTAEIDNQHATTPAGGLDVGGGWRVATEAGTWVVSVEKLAAGVTSVTGVLRGALPDEWSDIGATAVTGQLEGQIGDLQQLARELQTMGLTDAVGVWQPRGRASWRINLGGTVSQPHIAGELTATGGVRGQPDGLALQAAFLGTGGNWRVDEIDLHVADSVLTGAATVQADTGAITGGLRLVVPDLASLAGFAPAAGLGAGELEIVVGLGGVVSSPQIDVAMTGEQLRVAGQSLAALDGQLRIGADQLLVERFVVQQPPGRLEATGRLNWASGDYRVSLTARDMRLSPLTQEREMPVELGARFDLDLAGTGSVDSPRGTARVVLRDLVYGDVAIEQLRQDIVLDQDEWEVRTVVPSLNVSSNLRIEPHRPWRYRLDAELKDADLTGLVGGVVDVDGALRGVLSGSIAAHGELGAWSSSEVTLGLDRIDASYGDLPIRLGAPARIRSSSSGLRLDEPLDLRLGGTQLIASGLLRDDDSVLVATLAGDLHDIVSLVDATRGGGDDGDPVMMRGSYRLDLRLIGSTRQPSLSASLMVDDGVVEVADMAPLTDLRLRAAYDGDGVIVERVSGRWQEASLRGDVVVPAAVIGDALPAWLARPASSDDRPARMTLVVDRLGPEALTGFVASETLDDLSGEIGVEINLVAARPELAALEGAVTLTTMELEAAGFPVSQQRPTRLTIADERVTVEGWAWQIGAAENALTLGGFVDLVPEPTADLTVTGVADLSVLNMVSSGAAVAGDLYLIASLGGTLSEPTIDGVVEVTDGEVRVPDPRLLLSDLSGALVFQGATLETIDLVGTANGGPIAVDVDIRFPGFRPEGTVTVSGELIPLVVPPGVRTELSTELLLTITPDDADLTGVVTVLRGDYREAVNTGGGLRAMLESRTDLDLSETEPSVVDDIRLNVQVRTVDDIVVNNNYGAGSLSADTRLVGSLGRPGLTGRAAVGDGGQIFLGGNAFQIETGTIDFVDPDGVVPELDISARTQVGDEVITITLEGTAETLTTTMQSSGNLSESDIVSLLLTGRTLDQVGSAPGAVARDQALGLVSGEVLGVAGRSVGLDTVRLDRGTESDVRFDPSLAAGETDPGTRLTVGKSLSRQVELVASQSLRESGLVTWIVNYLPRRNIELRLVIDDETDRSYEFRHAVTFGQRPRETTTTQRQPEPRVSGVQVSGDTGELETELRRLVRLETGNWFDFLRWQDSRDRI